MYNIAFTAETHTKLRRDTLERELEARQLRRAARKAREKSPSQVMGLSNPVTARLAEFGGQRWNALRTRFTRVIEPREQCC